MAKKGGTRKAKAPSRPETMAVGAILQPPSSFCDLKAPLTENRPPPTPPAPAPLPVKHTPQAPPARLPIAVVRAASNNDVETVRAWLRSGGPPNAVWSSLSDRSVRGFTLLMLASLRGHEVLAEAMLECRADPNMQDSHGATALIIAAANGHQGIVHKLLRRGARTDLVSTQGGTASEIAKARGQHVIAQLIRTHEATAEGGNSEALPDAIVKAAKVGNAEIVEQWIDCGGDVDAVFDAEQDSTLLILACSGEQRRRRRRLCPSEPTHPNLPARHAHVQQLRPHLAHASPAPLSCATDESRRISGGHERVAEVLLRRGAAVERKRADGQTAMMIAAYMGHRGIVRQLVMHQRSAMLAHESLSTPIDVPGAQCDVLKHECHRA